MWEVDPETRSKLLEIQKRVGNNVCCDCNAPAPQWASPKFGIFICLTCAGTHRGLGVHISFVRSITMDAFKAAEILRMSHGGNNAWKDFFNAYAERETTTLSWDEATVAERYSGDAGDEYKERLTAKVEDRDYIASERKPTAVISKGNAIKKIEPRALSPSAKAQSEKYFAGLGSANASRPDDLPPSQGGKYAGFGSAPPEKKEETVPGFDELQNDPVAALTKGFGWFTTTVGRSAKQVNEGWIQPTAQKIAESEITAQARQTAVQLGQGITSTTKSTAESLNKLVDGGGKRSTPVDKDKQDFWDNFGVVPENATSAVGTTALKKPEKKKDSEWDSWD